MLTHQPYPILEFDPNPQAKLSASQIVANKTQLPEQCVITFFRESLQKLAADESLPQLGWLRSEIADLPIYRAVVEGKEVAVTLSFLGSAGAAGVLEELHAMGANRFIVCGGAGCLVPGLDTGRLILPTCAVRDEGASYHYLPPAREVSCDPNALQQVKDELERLSVPYQLGKTWTTDAIYRETEDKIALRASEGCLTVEMECAAFFAVSRFLSLPLVQLLYAGDDLSGESWDQRAWNQQYTTRENLLRLSIMLAGRL